MNLRNGTPGSLKIRNENILVDVEKKSSWATIYGTSEYELLEAKNSWIDAYNTKHQK